MSQFFKPTKQPKQLSNLNRLPKIVYPMRILGMTMAAIAIAAVMLELDAGTGTWIWLGVGCFIWPHLAYAATKLSQKPYKTEQYNLLVDSIIAGSWIPLMGFNILPSVLLILLNVTDKVNTAVTGLWIKAIIVSLISIAIFSLLPAATWYPRTSYNVMLACLPLIIIHFSVVSFNASRLIQKVQNQNRLLNKLSQQDDLTHLFNRRTWQQKTQLMLDNYHPEKEGPLSLMLIDIDRFKRINDDHGHAIGDDVLIKVAQIVSDNCEDDTIISRLGGDEYIVVVRADLQKAQTMAKNINRQVENIKMGSIELDCTTSIGIATIKHDIQDIRTWYIAADEALYEAKKLGRNQSVGKLI